MRMCVCIRGRRRVERLCVCVCVNEKSAWRRRIFYWYTFTHTHAYTRTHIPHRPSFWPWSQKGCLALPERAQILLRQCVAVLGLPFSFGSVDCFWWRRRGAVCVWWVCMYVLVHRGQQKRILCIHTHLFTYLTKFSSLKPILKSAAAPAPAAAGSSGFPYPRYYHQLHRRWPPHIVPADILYIFILSKSHLQ